ncbi:glycosyltransferase family 4 protein [Schizophyllum commune H4-8]|uniref:glycosyltransferase family 4 protein n=1 Tax=Schizophyllum commune (strain H4-8 / FGSC 9210) TaxID=578458 RepID=UPI0021609179|nr:glycosyltransferase family 4 protein [Schizophyllum commune H4-8]KAI5888774.1 glycosyltransferase family 4 protein [Schizophyllum commune H4-8]
MVGDFFHPNVGGVENHIYMLGVQLLARGHKVIVITHSHRDRVGIRWLLPGLKVYHIPFPPIANSATLPNFFTFLPYFRTIILREHIQLVHAHASLSSLGHEALLHAHLLGVRTVFSDHSLFGFEDAASILTNKLLVGTLKNVDAVICVSHTGRENTVLRGQLFEPREDDPTALTVRNDVYVIPNALVADHFVPDPPTSTDIITIVVMSRLAYRKGIDLLVATAPHVCRLFPNVRFLVGGTGPKLIDLLQMREKHRLQDRIELLGPVAHGDVLASFGIAILEAACAGLYVVSTRVGGVPEILPEDMICFAEPEEDDVVRAIARAVRHIQAGAHDPLRAHARVRTFYDWAAVTGRTERVYRAVIAAPERDLMERMRRNLSLGPWFGMIQVIILVVDCLFFLILEWLIPREDIDYVTCSWDAGKAREALREAEDYEAQEGEGCKAKGGQAVDGEVTPDGGEAEEGMAIDEAKVGDGD